MRAVHPYVACVAAALLIAASGLLPGVAAIGGQGPYEGEVVEGQTKAHVYVTPPRVCIIAPTYYVTLAYAPASDVLALQAAGRTDVGDDGSAQVVFEGDCSADFVITVTGVVVASVAQYTVTVQTG